MKRTYFETNKRSEKRYKGRRRDRKLKMVKRDEDEVNHMQLN